MSKLRSVTMIASWDATMSGSEAIRSRSTVDDGSDRASAWRGSAFGAGILPLALVQRPPAGGPGRATSDAGGRALVDPSPWPLTDEERLVRETAREFAEREVAPGAIERDETERYDRSLFARMGALGLTAAPFPESVGGAAFSYVGWSLVMEELGRVDMAMAVSLSVHILSQYPVVTWGTEEQRARWLPAMLAGDALGAFALTEPHAGSDAAAIRLRASRSADGSSYELTGTKIWISNAPEAERYLVFAVTDATAGSRGLSAFLVERGTPGFAFGAHE
jgi:acyl-CoA dehydrogenase